MQPSNASVPGIVPDLTLGDLRALVDQIRREHPNSGTRLDHAAFIATFREVERGTSAGVWWVQSEVDPNQTYMVTAGQVCCCQDFARRGELTPCKHLLAVAIVERAERLEAERADPTCVTCGASLGERARWSYCCQPCHAAACVEIDTEQADPTPIPAATRYPGNRDPDAPIDLELTETAYAALAALGEPCAIAPQRPIGITRIPYTPEQQRIADELYGPEPA